MRQQLSCAFLMAFLLLGPQGGLAQQQQLDVIQFRRTVYTVLETTGSVSIEIERTGPMTDFALVQLSTGGGTAGSADYQAFSDTIEFSPGQSNLTVTIDLLNDAWMEGNEWFEVTLSDPDPFCCRLGANTRAVVSIEDNDFGVQFDSSWYEVREDTPEVRITLQRSGDLVGEEGDVALSILDLGTAGLNTDFGGPSDLIIHFPAGTSAIVVSIPILNDSLVEGVEDFLVQLVHDEFNLPLGLLSSAEVVILDNDFGVEFFQTSHTATENGGAIEIRVQRMGDPTNAFTVDLLTSGTAVNGTDFVLSTNRLHFADGQTNLVVLVGLVDDPFVEGEEVIHLTLANSTANVPLGWRASCEIELRDNEYPVNMVDPTFAYSSSATITAMLVQTNGKILLASPLQRLNANWEREMTFNPEVYGITSLAVQPDGKILCAGEFSTYYPNRFYYGLVRFDQDGAFDTSFSPSIGPATSITSLAVLSDGKMLIGGTIVLDATTPPRGIARLTSSGALDSSFNVVLDLPLLNAILVQPDGKIIIAGAFNTVQGQVRAGIARLLPDGLLDEPFNASLLTSNAVSALALEAGGNILAVIANNRVVRLRSSDGAIDPSFQSATGPSSRIQEITVQPDGKVLLLSDIFGSDHNRIGAIARLNTNGSLDTTFSSAIGNTFVTWLDGRIFTADGGNLVRLLPHTPMSSVSFSSNQFHTLENGRREIVTLRRGGNSSSTLTVDLTVAGNALPGLDYLPGGGTVTFHPLETASEIIAQIVNDCEGETNEFVEITLTNAAPGTEILHPSRTTLSIVDDDAAGSLDAFDPRLDWITFPPFGFDPRTTIALQSDGKIVLSHRGIITRVNSDGSQDISFAQEASLCGFSGLLAPSIIIGGSCSVNAIAIEDGGHILAGGIGSIRRLRPNGGVDTNFVVVAYSFGHHGTVYPGRIDDLLLQPDGKILVFGSWHVINGYFRNLVRLNRDSTVDASFALDPTVGFVTGVALQSDGKLIVVNFSTIVRLNADGSRDNTFAAVNTGEFIPALAVSPDQKILVAAAATLMRLHPNGALDTSFNPAIVVEGSELTSASALAITKDGNILVGGLFADETVRVVKLDSSGRRVMTFNSDLRFEGNYEAAIKSIIEQPNDSKVLVAGLLHAVNSISRRGVARLTSERSHIQLSPPALQPDGSLRLVTASQTGNRYVLQSSVDLMAWNSLATNVANACTLEFLDPNPASNSFYRVVKIEP